MIGCSYVRYDKQCAQYTSYNSLDNEIHTYIHTITHPYKDSLLNVFEFENTRKDAKLSYWILANTLDVIFSQHIHLDNLIFTVIHVFMCACTSILGMLCEHLPICWYIWVCDGAVYKVADVLDSKV